MLFIFISQSPITSHADALGVPRVVDGDTLRLGGEKVRLLGIDAPETNQTCSLYGKDWLCGKDATNALRQHIGTNAVRCEGNQRDRYKRLIAICYLGNQDLNAWLVREGWAVAYRRYSKKYVAEESEAKTDNNGIWASDFLLPWEWRKAQ